MISILNPSIEIAEKLILSMGMNKTFAIMTVEPVVKPTNKLRKASFIPGIWTIITRRNQSAKAFIKGNNLMNNSLLKNGFPWDPDFASFEGLTCFSVFEAFLFEAGFG